MVTKIKIYPDAGEKVTNTSECRNFLERVVGVAENRAKDTAPVDTGNYQDSIGSGLIDGETNAVAEFYTEGIDYWTFIEFGCINYGPKRILTNAAKAVCDRVEAG